MDPSRSQTTLRRFFAGLAEYTFMTRLGVADPPLVDYITDLLIRFVRNDAIFHVRSPAGDRLREVAQMLAEAEARVGAARREVHRHIGDFTLFWTGVYPEALGRMQNASSRDFLLDYRQHGKRAYLIASTLSQPDDGNEGELLERLSREYELCEYGLGELRREWERRNAEDDETAGPWLIN